LRLGLLAFNRIASFKTKANCIHMLQARFRDYF
jgi:hypothetical protein